ncbi:hypothetical protein OAJ74_00280 [Alphaproteobacteria bacterium]|nr:hypothetical protein [Alphaproteobacteria bacterium]
MTPISTLSVPNFSAFSLIRIPTDCFITNQTIKDVIKTKILTEKIPISCDPKDVSGLDITTASIPYIPANKCIGIVPAKRNVDQNWLTSVHIVCALN